MASDVEEAVTYKRYINTTPGDSVAGIPDTDNYETLDISASVRELTLKEIQVSGGVYVMGDMEFKIRQTKLTLAPAYADHLVYDGANYKPKNISHSFLAGIIGWTIRAGKV